MFSYSVSAQTKIPIEEGSKHIKAVEEAQGSTLPSVVVPACKVQAAGLLKDTIILDVAQVSLSLLPLLKVESLQNAFFEQQRQTLKASLKCLIDSIVNPGDKECKKNLLFILRKIIIVMFLRNKILNLLGS